MGRLSHTNARVEHSRNSKRFKNNHTEQNAGVLNLFLNLAASTKNNAYGGMLSNAQQCHQNIKTKIKIQLKIKI